MKCAYCQREACGRVNSQYASCKGFYALRDANKFRQQEWDPESKISIEYRGNELAGEVGEACNIIKKFARERLGLWGSLATKEMLAKELADVVICADLIAMQMDIDLDKAVREKFNETSEKIGLSIFMVTK